jgi:hypothetical protein
MTSLVVAVTFLKKHSLDRIVLVNLDMRKIFGGSST